ncbi:MAG: hypothetical protein AB8F95_03745 [Bacteroidia bacterium]
MDLFSNKILDNESVIEIANFIKKRLRAGKAVEIVFICTHNSRRSQFAQAWCQLIADVQNLSVQAYSAGTEVAEVHSSVLKTLQDDGFKIVALDRGTKQAFELKREDISNPIQLYSKNLQDNSIPREGFLAVMVCSDADEACPVVPGAAHRVSLPFDDPRHADGTEEESQAYRSCSTQILSYLSTIFFLVEEEKRQSQAAPKAKPSFLKKVINMIMPSRTASARPDILTTRKRDMPDMADLMPKMMDRERESMPMESAEVEEIEEMAPPPPPVPSAPAPPMRSAQPAASASAAPPRSSQPTPVNPFKKGNILYSIPEQMKLKEASRCRVRIAPEEIDAAVLERDLSEAEKENAKTEGIRTTSVMKVELEELGDHGQFEIVFRSDEEQPVFPFDFTEWEFDVTPKRPGHGALLLRVTAKVVLEGFGEKGMNVAVLDRAILVTTDGSTVLSSSFKKQPIPDPVWDPEDEKAVRSFVAEGQLNKAIARINNYIADKDEDTLGMLLVLQNRWNTNTNKLEENRIRHEDWDVVNSQVSHSVLAVLEDEPFLPII